MCLLNPDVVKAYGVSQGDLEQVTRREMQELERRERQYRGARKFPDLTGKTVLLIDDGLATGASMRVAVEALRLENPASVVVGVPVAAPETCESFRDITDDIVCAITPEPFYAVGLWYEDFAPTSDEEVHRLLDRALAA
jgi:putative phosphoribosyl transferase